MFTDISHQRYFRNLRFKIVVHETENMCDKNGFISANLCTSPRSFDKHSWTARFIYLNARSDTILTFEMLIKKFVPNARSIPAGSAKIEAIEQDVVTDIEKCLCTREVRLHLWHAHGALSWLFIKVRIDLQKNVVSESEKSPHSL
jgi:hypothetical protein